MEEENLEDGVGISFDVAACHKGPALMHSMDIGKLAGALAKARKEMGHAEKNAKNPHLRNTYADLASVLDACKPINDHGLVVLHGTSGDVNALTVECKLIHESGQWISCAVTLTPKSVKKGEQPSAQDVGSAITYGRRYTLSALMGISQEDDDGNAASGVSGQNAARSGKEMPAQKQVPPFDAAAAALTVKLEGVQDQEQLDECMPELAKLKVAYKEKKVSGPAMKALVAAYEGAQSLLNPVD